LDGGRIGAGFDQLKLNRRAAAIEHQDIHELILRETRQKSTCGAFHAVNSACLSPNLNFAGAIEMPAAAPSLRAESRWFCDDWRIARRVLMPDSWAAPQFFMQREIAADPSHSLADGTSLFSKYSLASGTS
jgi:hypothetical protein